jgi:hypothetical protein
MVCKTVTHKITNDLHLIDIGLNGNYIFGEWYFGTIKFNKKSCRLCCRGK